MCAYGLYVCCVCAVPACERWRRSSRKPSCSTPRARSCPRTRPSRPFSRPAAGPTSSSSRTVPGKAQGVRPAATGKAAARRRRGQRRCSWRATHGGGGGSSGTGTRSAWLEVLPGRQALVRHRTGCSLEYLSRLRHTNVAGGYFSTLFIFLFFFVLLVGGCNPRFAHRWRSVEAAPGLSCGPSERPLRHFRAGGGAEQSVLDCYVAKRCDLIS